MAQKPIELILMRQLASLLATPVFLVDQSGVLVFYNEAAEGILGRRFDETGEMPAAEWSTAFAQTDDDGRPIAPEALPLMTALRESRPDHGRFTIRGLDGVRRRIEATAFPLLGGSGASVGAVVIFCEAGKSCA